MSDLATTVRAELDQQLAEVMREIASEHERALMLRGLWGERLVLLCLLPFYVGLSEPLGVAISAALVMASSGGMLLGAWLIRGAAMGRVHVSSVRLKRPNARLKLVDSRRH